MDIDVDLIKKSLPKQDVFLRVLSLICGIGMFILSIFDFADYKVDEPIDVFLPLYYAIFGVLMIVSEFRPGVLIRYFRFLCETFGKGMFYIFSGTMCIKGSFVLQYIMAAYCIAIGVFILCCKAVDGEPQASDPPEGQ
ncbi:unnamed protein product [Blepharisma stoltei]|uniref:COPI associated protein n=1 Tax=Blepharisma stoltei TaxID=1481888 RepID=A0AAU9K6S8_9CILI|nr:unnamed protein product [Blepharisma stoltei]